MNEKTKNYGKSIRSKLLNVSKQEGIFYQTVLTRYFQERVLYRLSQTRYRDHFFLKGGALMYAHERFAARPTLDIDFLGSGISNDGGHIVSAFREICSVDCPEDGVAFDVERITSENITEQKDYHGIRLHIPVAMDTISQVLSMDIGFGDVITPSPVQLDYPLLISTLPQASIMAYSVETVIAEKMHAVIDLGNQSSRMKDYYDLFHLLHEVKYDPETLTDDVVNTFRNRHTGYTEDAAFFSPSFKDDLMLTTRWNAFMRRIKSDNSLTFSEVVVYLQNALGSYWEVLRHD